MNRAVLTGLTFLTYVGKSYQAECTVGGLEELGIGDTSYFEPQPIFTAAASAYHQTVNFDIIETNKTDEMTKACTRLRMQQCKADVDTKVGNIRYTHLNKPVCVPFSCKTEAEFFVHSYPYPSQCRNNLESCEIISESLKECEFVVLDDPEASCEYEYNTFFISLHNLTDDLNEDVDYACDDTTALVSGCEVSYLGRDGYLSPESTEEERCVSGGGQVCNMSSTVKLEKIVGGTILYDYPNASICLPNQCGEGDSPNIADQYFNKQWRNQEFNVTCDDEFVTCSSDVDSLSCKLPPISDPPTPGPTTSGARMLLVASSFFALSLITSLFMV